MHFENFKPEIIIPGAEREKTSGNRLAPKKLTHYHMKNWINNAGLDEDTKKELLVEITKYPANTMHHFFDNIHKHIARIHRKRRKKAKE